MILSSGTSILHYRLAEKIGVGGMGEVWKATDTTLGRDVAIKILPAEFASDAERLARFEREAKVLASLNHPNIAGIYGLHEFEGVRFLAMELVPGEDLAERLRRGPVPVEEARVIAHQIAAGLEAAHERGIVHRDLKPANVKLTPEGIVKVLDFGLAKAFVEENIEAPGDPSRSPTLTASTRAGIILGTAAYMSPEQARGTPVDRRADIWAFGCVSYELLTAKRPFEGQTISDTLAAVLTRTPDWNALPAAVPGNLRRLLHRCLEKDPKKRLRDIGDARIELEEDAKEGEGSLTKRSASRAKLPLAVALGVGVGAIAVAAWFLGRPTEDKEHARLTRLEIARPPDAGHTGPGTFAIAPDGSAVVFSIHTFTNAAHLWIRDLDDPIGRVLAGTEKASFPFWSPDSRDIAFFAGGRLKRVSRTGGPVRDVCDALDGRGGAWGSSGVIVFAPDTWGPLFRVDARGGVPEPATTLDAARSERSHRFPCFLPDGRHFTYCVLPNGQTSLASLDDSHGRPLALGGICARYAAPGYLVFWGGSSLLAQRIDSQELKLVGKPLPLAEGPEGAAVKVGVALVDCADDGTLVYDQQDSRPIDILWVGRDGRLLETVIRYPGQVNWHSLSHHGDRLAIVGRYDSSALWVVDLAKRTEDRISKSGRNITGVVWTPNDDRIVVGDFDRGGLDSLDPKSGEERSIVPAGAVSLAPTSVAPDGTVVLQGVIAANRNDIAYLPRGEGSETRPYLASPADENGGIVSPDGKLVAYSSDASGRREVYIDAFPVPRGSIRVSTDGTEGLAGWRDDGHEIYFFSVGRKSFMACDVRTSPVVDVGKPHVLFEPSEGIWSLTPGPHGDRFLAFQTVGQNPSALMVVHDWAAQLEKDAGSKP